MVKHHIGSRRHARRGAMMLLALLTVTIAFVIGLSLLSTSTALVSTSDITAKHAQARQIAESGMNVALSYLERTPTWRTDRPQGMWVNNSPMLDGTVTIEASFEPEAIGSSTVTDPSFENQVGALATPLLNPPMSGVIGGWSLRRTALVQTGLLVPQIGTEATAHATLGTQAGYVKFNASVTGSGTFSQTLSTTLTPLTRYELSVDVTVSTGASNLTSGFQILAGSTVVASSETAWTLALPATLTNPTTPPGPDTYNAILQYAGLTAGSPTTYTLTFVTDANPPSGPLTIELSAKSTGLLASAWFDNVRLVSRRNDPVVLTVTGRNGMANHVLKANVVRAFDGRAKVVSWSEP